MKGFLLNRKAEARIKYVAVLFVIVILAVGVFAANLNESNITEENIAGQINEQQVNESIKSILTDVSNVVGVSENTEKYIKEFIDKRKIRKEQINNITEVDLNSLPDDVNIENVNDANVGIFEINYNETNQTQKKLFVVTYSVQELGSKGDLVVSKDVREFLNFGYSIESNSSTFLQSATGVQTSAEAGYVMMRKGSITGMSTNLEIIKDASGGWIELIIFKNGKSVNFGNEIDASSIGVKKDYDTQSKGIITFEPGDVISVYLDVHGSVGFKNVITMIEITSIA